MNEPMPTPVGFRALVKRSYTRINCTGLAPLAWHRSKGAPLQKGAKLGPKGKRVVHVLRTQGKAFYEKKMAAKQPRAFSHEDHGFLRGRIFAGALVVQQNGLWRATR